MPLLIAILSLALSQDDLETRIRELDSKVLPAPDDGMIGRDASARVADSNRRESEAWARIRGREDWERYRDVRLRTLRDSLGAAEPVPADLRIRVTRMLQGRGHRVECLVYESRPGLLVTANLYVPMPERASMPGMVIVHSHHNPKTQGELQDMGVMWARAGCLVLVPDLLGHGERRQHPFVDGSSYPGAYRVGRQDYFFRYVTGLQLHLAGESLIGWMAWDLMRGVDLLLSRPGIDSKRIILLGSVAGGGDPAAVTAALDPRITAAAPFNFGGPQPETRYPLPENAETWFNYAGGGSWESTRNLRRSCREGFLPWVIVGGIAPRHLIYGHEFSWDREHDPVWKRLETIYGFYQSGDSLFSATGRGTLKGQPPEASHCNN
ncbi:MAG TPA: acetylxylan esterase, partial [Planctomycetota bacterium]|nr:acetylxylan esterase [Planctomycetota bacterium]